MPATQKPRKSQQRNASSLLCPPCPQDRRYLGSRIVPCRALGVTVYRKRAKRAPARPRPRAGSTIPAEDFPVEELPELPAVAVPEEEPEPPTLVPVADEEPEVALPVLEAFRVPVLTVPLVELLPDWPVAKGAEPAEPTTVARVATVDGVTITDGVPAGTVATAG